MKKILIALVIILCICGCSNVTGNANGEVNVLNWSSYIPSEIIDEFEREYNIKVNYGTYSSNEELLAKISSSKEGTYDLIFPSDYMVELMISKNMLDKMDKTKLENFKNINILFLHQRFDLDNEYSLPFLAATSVIAVNRKNIKEDIKTYNDLLNPKYKNNIVLIDDQRIIIGMALQALGYKEVVEYLENKLTKEEMIDKIKMESRRYAKRQLTWFRKNKQTIWLNGQDSIEHNISIILEEMNK